MNSYVKQLDVLGRPEYHQFIKCSRTNSRVGFAEAGGKNKPTLLFVVPSFCSRLIGAPMLAQLAEHYGVRVVSIDRPGCGGTPECPLSKRLDIASDNTRSVLEYLGVEPESISISTHSAGCVFTLHLLDKHPDLFPKNPRVFMTSGWVPTSVSGQIGFSLIPSVLVSNFHNMFPIIFPLANNVAASIGFSKGLIGLGGSKDTTVFTPPDTMRPLSAAPSTHHRNHSLQIPGPTNNALFNCVTKLENMQGVSEEYRLCLGRGEGSIDPEWYTEIVSKLSEAYKERGGCVHFELWWGLSDAIIPVKGQKWFVELLKKQGPSIDVVSYDLIDAGHDDLLAIAEVVCPIFEEVRSSLSV